MAGRPTSSAQKSAVREIQAGLRALARGFRLLAKETSKKAMTRRTGRRVSPGRRIHGRYIGLIRNMTAQDKAKVRAIHAKKGVEAAIKMALGLRRPR